MSRALLHWSPISTRLVEYSILCLTSQSLYECDRTVIWYEWVLSHVPVKAAEDSPCWQRKGALPEWLRMHLVSWWAIDWFDFEVPCGCVGTGCARFESWWRRKRGSNQRQFYFCGNPEFSELYLNCDLAESMQRLKVKLFSIRNAFEFTVQLVWVMFRWMWDLKRSIVCYVLIKTMLHLSRPVFLKVVFRSRFHNQLACLRTVSFSDIQLRIVSINVDLDNFEKLY